MTATSDQPSAEQFAAGLEALAAFFRANPDLPVPGYRRLTIHPRAGDVPGLARAVGIERVERSRYSSESVELVRDFGPVEFVISTTAEGVGARMEAVTVEQAVLPTVEELLAEPVEVSA